MRITHRVGFMLLIIGKNSAPVNLLEARQTFVIMANELDVFASYFETRGKRDRCQLFLHKGLAG